jgi:signal transduction histidine kinase/CheY-like chemotaxis protein
VGHLAQLLKDNRDRIVGRFILEVQRKDLSPRGVMPSLLIDHIPRFLDEIAAELRQMDEVRFSQDAIDTSASARRHGGQRWSLGYDLNGLMREYGILRHCILQTAKEVAKSITIDEFDVLAKCLSVGVAEAATEYARVRDEQLGAQKATLEFLAEAGQLLSSSLDYRSTLRRLTELLVPRMADCCGVHLDGIGVDEMPLAHVDLAKTAVLRDMYRRYPLPSDSPYGHRYVARTGEPQLISEVNSSLLEAAAQDSEHLSLLRTINVRSWLVVPLRVQGNMIGALSLAYCDSGRRYGQDDIVLASEVARRAAVAIDNARLFELSQNERSRVEAATRAKDEFVAMVSHELRTPLHAILGWLRLMRSGSLPEGRRGHAFEVIERNAEAQSQIVDDLLDISRVFAGKIRITLSQVDLANVVDMVVEGVRPAADAKRIRIETDVDRNHAVMRGDGDRLQQVVWNLLSNAVKFTPKHGVVKVSLKRVDSDLELTVEDNGPGIAGSFLPHVFETFRQSEGGAARSHGGLGIGLSIAKHIVELHGGSIEAQSPGEGRGATFAVWLPVSPLMSAAFGAHPPATKAQSANGTIPAGLEGISVLVVDDEADARELVAYVLEASGMEVRVAENSADAMTQLESFTPRVIVSDIGMPHEDGYTLIRRIRTLPADDKRTIPAIALTGFARNEDRTRALVEGFNRYMAKPVEPSALVSTVADLAGAARP